MATRWGQNWGRGISYRGHDLPKPWRVKFFRNHKWIQLGDFARLREAQAAAEAFLAKSTTPRPNEGISNGPQ